MLDTSLTSDDAQRILRWLGLAGVTRDRLFLDALLSAYAQHVPWESASRIVRRADRASADDCAVRPRAFWEQAMKGGLGGTCFESNAALAALLSACGFECVLTINDRPPLAACHTALIVSLDGQRLVVDAGFPLYAAVPLPTGSRPVAVHSRWGTFTAAPTGPGRFAISQLSHPRPLAFELVDRPVTPFAYEAATRADYGPTGLFLDRVILKKIVHGDMWRFATGSRPRVLERFHQGKRYVAPLPDDTDVAAAVLATHFAMDHGVVRRALELVTRSDAASPAR